jgi:hypothetical protein
LFKILSKKSRKKSFALLNEIKSNSKIDFIETNSVLEIYFIVAASFNTLSRQKNVQIFAVFMKDLNIQLKKQKSKKVIDLKSIISAKYHDFLNVFSKKKADVLSSHRKHDHRIELKEEKIHEYVSLYNMSKEKLLLIKKYLQEHQDEQIIQKA